MNMKMGEIPMVTQAAGMSKEHTSPLQTPMLFFKNPLDIGLPTKFIHS